MSIKLAKAALRKEIKSKLQLLSQDQKQKEAAAIAEKLLQSSYYKESKRLSIFLSMDTEVHTLGILQSALQEQKICFIPRYDSKSTTMEMVKLHSWQDFNALPETKWKIKQPDLSEPREDAMTTGGVDLVLVPGLAFSLSGQRLGRGRGYYDTFLHHCSEVQEKPPVTVGLAFHAQIVDSIPMDDTDLCVDFVLTADGFHKVQ